MPLSNYFTDLWDKVQRADTFVPTYIEFPPEKTDEKDKNLKMFENSKHYFMVSVCEMFLSYKRLWHREFSPMVFSVCNFKYNGTPMEMPYVIGPSNLEKYKQKVPKGMLFLNTPIVGVHPWRGDNVSLSIILCRIEEKNNIDKLLQVIEDVSNSLDFSGNIGHYVKVGRTIIKGFDSLLGFDQTTPLLGMNNNFGQAANNPFHPGYYALINAGSLDINKFWVKENRLCFGESLEKAEPYREDDYILYKIGCSVKRDDLRSLNFYKTYERVYEYIRNQIDIDKIRLENLKSRLRQLAVEIRLSPDLTKDHGDIVWIELKESIEEFVKKLSKLDATKSIGKTTDPIDKIMNQALDDLIF